MSGNVKPGTDPNWARCDSCGHTWIWVYLPLPVKLVVKLGRALRCPKCGGASTKIYMHTLDNGDSHEEAPGASELRV